MTVFLLHCIRDREIGRTQDLLLLRLPDVRPLPNFKQLQNFYHIFRAQLPSLPPRPALPPSSPPPLPLALVVAVSALCSAEQAPLSADYVHLFMLRHFAILGPQMEASEGWVLLFFVVLFLFFSFGVLLLLFSFFKN